MTFFNLFDAPLSVSVQTEEAGWENLAFSHDAEAWTGAGGVLVRLEAEPERAFQRVALSAPDRAVRQIHLRWSVAVPENLRYLGDHWERGYGDLEWRGLVPERKMPWYFLAHDGTETHGYGVATGAFPEHGAIAWWQSDNAGISLFLDVCSGSRGVQLGDRILGCAAILTRQGQADETPFAAAQAFCRLLCPTPRLPAEPVYGGNDWYYAYGNNSDDSIRHDAALIRRHSPDGPNRPFMVIDAGWFPARGCDGGPYEQGNERFPDMPGLAQAMKGMEVRPGIWIRPLLRDTDATPVAWRMPESHPLMRRNNGKSAYLDPSVPDVLEQVRADIARCAGWGYELIKHDFTTFDITGRWGFEMAEGATLGDWHFADRSRTTAEITRALYQTIRDAAGEALLIGCNTIGHLGAGLFELQRTGDDTSGREWERTRKMGINTLAFRMAQHNTFFAVDADCVGLTKKIPWPLNQQWLDLLARSGTPLFVSASPDAIGPGQSAALHDAFAHAAVSQSPAVPLDWLHTTCPRRWLWGDGTETIYDWFTEAT